MCPGYVPGVCARGSVWWSAWWKCPVECARWLYKKKTEQTATGHTPVGTSTGHFGGVLSGVCPVEVPGGLCPVERVSHIRKRDSCIRNFHFSCPQAGSQEAYSPKRPKVPRMQHVPMGPGSQETKGHPRRTWAPTGPRGDAMGPPRNPWDLNQKKLRFQFENRQNKSKHCAQ